MGEKILITGGTGMVGQKISGLLSENGYEVYSLSRSNKPSDKQCYYWDPKNDEIEPAAFDQLDHIIHLAGAGVADKRWSSARKQIIHSSRVDTAELLYRKVKEHKVPLKSYITASGIGIYGNYCGETLKDEKSPHGTDFLAGVVEDWEKAGDLFQNDGIRTVKMRIGVVLSNQGGALVKIAQPIRWLVGAPLGSGDQFMSWVHVDDLARMFLLAIQNQHMNGPYNAVNPNPVTNKEMTKIIARTLKKPLWLPNVPSWVLKLALGEMASIVLGGAVVSGARIESEGFKPKFTEAQSAISDLLSDN